MNVFLTSKRAKHTQPYTSPRLKDMKLKAVIQIVIFRRSCFGVTSRICFSLCSQNFEVVPALGWPLPMQRAVEPPRSCFRCVFALGLGMFTLLLLGCWEWDQGCWCLTEPDSDLSFHSLRST